MNDFTLFTFKFYTFYTWHIYIFFLKISINKQFCLFRIGNTKQVANFIFVTGTFH